MGDNTVYIKKKKKRLNTVVGYKKDELNLTDEKFALYSFHLI